MITTLREWQYLIKHPQDFIVQASTTEHADGWQPFPIGMGFDYVTIPQTIQSYQQGSHDHLVLCSFSSCTDQKRRGKSPICRQNILSTLKKQNIHNKRFNTSQEYFSNLPKYKFIISPEGNGIDCHRHYHAFMAGCIPIIEYNANIADKYSGCPILFTTDYSEITSQYLEAKYIEMLDQVYDFSSLFLSSYSSKIQTDIKTCGNYWCEKLAGVKWYDEYPFILLLKDRYHVNIYHWFIYMIAILGDILTYAPTILFHTNHDLPLQQQTFPLLLPKYVFTTLIPSHSHVIHLEGVPLLSHDKVSNRYFYFIRKQILQHSNVQEYLSNHDCFNQSKRIFISRNRTHNLPWHDKKCRQIVNEADILDLLVKKFHFHVIYLEDLPLLEKIHLFQSSAIIVSVFGGSLFTSIFASPRTKIVEITYPFTDLTYENHYSYICQAIGIQFFRYTNVDILDPSNENMTITPFVGKNYSLRVLDLNIFEKFISHLIF